MGMPATDDENVKRARTASRATNIVANKNAAHDSCNIFLGGTHEGKTYENREELEGYMFPKDPRKSTLLAKVKTVPRRDLAAS